MKKVIIYIITFVLVVSSSMVAMAAGYPTGTNIPYNGRYVRAFITTNYSYIHNGEACSHHKNKNTYVTWNEAGTPYTYTYGCGKTGVMYTVGYKLYSGSTQCYELNAKGKRASDIYTRFTKDSEIPNSIIVTVSGTFSIHNYGAIQN
ncbi:MAG: hypothetical protein Q4C01_07635 [Clostridia bacterium]|nr:hypothetical protein [Clostridia bacterium]